MIKDFARGKTRAEHDRFLYDQVLDSVLFLEKDYEYKVNKVNLEGRSNERHDASECNGEWKLKENNDFHKRVYILSCFNKT